MGKPSKPATVLIDVNDSDQTIRLALGALFTSVAIARGVAVNPSTLPQLMIQVADALMDAAARARDAP